jgi:hypothetical protein
MKKMRHRHACKVDQIPLVPANGFAVCQVRASGPLRASAAFVIGRTLLLNSWLSMKSVRWTFNFSTESAGPAVRLFSMRLIRLSAFQREKPPSGTAAKARGRVSRLFAARTLKI